MSGDLKVDGRIYQRPWDERRGHGNHLPRRLPGAASTGRPVRIERLDLAPNTLTFHFDRLRFAGLVSVRRDGRSMIYAARFEAMNNLLSFLTENCCQGAKEACVPVAVCKPKGARHEAVSRARRS